ncbi:MAG: hypothetical protein J0L58_18200 [Burkholderiales bacterium]|nr:hypothetical protein [Burkholderiales bacterium]
MKHFLGLNGLRRIALWSCLLPALAGAATIGAQQDGGLGQSSLSAAGDGFDRYAEPFWDGSLDLALLAGGVGPQPVYATGSSVRVQYGGTAAPQEARLMLAGDAAQLADASRLLFEARGAGCTYADWQVDAFCAIEGVSDWREIGDLAAGQALYFGLQGDALDSNDANDQVAIELFAHLGNARWVDLGAGRLMLGFENDGNGDYADWVFLFEGLSLQGPNAAVSEPGALALVLLAGLVGGRLRRR